MIIGAIIHWFILHLLNNMVIKLSLLISNLHCNISFYIIIFFNHWFILRKRISTDVSAALIICMCGEDENKKKTVTGLK